MELMVWSWSWSTVVVAIFVVTFILSLLLLLLLLVVMHKIFISFNRKFSTGNCDWMEVILVAWQPSSIISLKFLSLLHTHTLTYTYKQRHCLSLVIFHTKRERYWQAHTHTQAHTLKRIWNKNNKRKANQNPSEKKTHNNMMANENVSQHTQKIISTKRNEKQKEEVGKSRMKALYFYRKM